MQKNRILSNDQILEIHHWRYSCKEFDEKRKISERDFGTILESGRLSPSSFGVEPWKFVIVQNKALRNEISKVTWGGERQLATCSHYIIILNRIKDVIFQSEYLKRLMLETHMMNNEETKLKNLRFKDFQMKDFKLLSHPRHLEDWSAKQVYIALGNMMMTSAILGIDSCAIEGFNKEKLEVLLEKKGILHYASYGVAVMVAFGYGISEIQIKRRHRLEDISLWIE